MYGHLLSLILLFCTEPSQKTAAAYRGFHLRNDKTISKTIVFQQRHLFSHEKTKMRSVAGDVDTSPRSIDLTTRGRDLLKTIWNFSRPHTVIGSAISIVSLFMFAVSPSLWTSKIFLSALFRSIVPSIFMNLYITGLNQITDVDVDRINKPYLPMVSGALSYANGIVIIICSLLTSVLTSWGAEWPLLLVLFGSFLLGTMYSIPPFRLKR